MAWSKYTITPGAIGRTCVEGRRAVRACFEQAGAGGGFILAPSDHFFEADDGLLRAFADEARACCYPAAIALP